MTNDILSYGADPSGRALSTNALQQAIDDCAQSGGGQVRVPAGTYKSGTIYLKSHVELRVERGATLLASENLSDYNEFGAYPQNFQYAPEEWVGKHLILALECEDVAVTGDGAIDGNARAFYAEPEIRWAYLWDAGLALSKDKVNQRPGQLLTFVQCRDVRVENVTLQNATCWCCFLHGCDCAQIRGLRVRNDRTYANTDGIDLDCCRHVTVSDCIIHTGDDCVAIRASGRTLVRREPICEYITITNCVFSSASSVFRVGVGRGTIRHVRVSNIAISGGCVGMHVMGQCGAYPTTIEDVHFDNISADNVAYPLSITGTTEGRVRHVSVTNYRARCCAMAEIGGDAPGCVADARLRDVTFDMYDKPIPPTEKARAERGEHMLLCRNVDGLTLSDVRVDKSSVDPALWGEPVRIERCSGQTDVLCR